MVFLELYQQIIITIWQMRGLRSVLRQVKPIWYRLGQWRRDTRNACNEVARFSLLLDGKGFVSSTNPYLVDLTKISSGPQDHNPVIKKNYHVIQI